MNENEKKYQKATENEKRPTPFCLPLLRHVEYFSENYVSQLWRASATPAFRGKETLKMNYYDNNSPRTTSS